MRLDLPRTRIAVAALNPRAGEGGLFGRQDIDVSEPMIEQADADGLDVVGWVVTRFGGTEYGIYVLCGFPMLASRLAHPSGVGDR